MGAISSLRTTGGALARNPVVFVGALLVALLSVLVQVPQFAGQAIGSPALSILLSVLVPALSFFISPFLVGGLLGMANEAVAGETSLGAFVRAGKARYVTLLLSTLLYTVVLFALFIGLAIIAAIVVLVAGVSLGGAGGDPSAVIGIAILLAVLVLLLVFLLVVFFVQFYTVAVVVEDAGVVECFKRSYRLVRENLLSTLGYNLLSVFITLVVAVPILIVVAVALLVVGGFPSAPATPGPAAAPTAGFDFPLATIAVGAVGFFAIQILNSAITQTYSVAFYRDRRRLDSVPEDTDAPSQEPIEY